MSEWSDTIKAILGGIAIAMLLGLIAVLIYLFFQKVMSIIAGFFAWVIIQMAILG